MKLLGMWTLASALALTLVSAPARAQSCSRGCESDAEVCKAVCKKYGGKMAGKCNEACMEEKDACQKDCKTGGYTPRKGDTDDAHASH
ncbi:hypothetical protein KRR26_25975 [Corallococcus sp. M34]|uniref:hypothetical protein n=1 Tax=Citreicoccus inhibens TaxID=2849499 RepID=UPI001C246AA0|nr:hypothetical protein [Citreicoccus inhibens]MBU8899065.1 hypothetical protein [Citreicoccus inhibens]